MSGLSRQLRFVSLLAVALFIAGVGRVADAQVHVWADAPGGNNGTTWTDAYTSLSNAIVSSVDGVEMWVAAGSHTPGLLEGDKFVIGSRKLYGGFDGTETARDQRDVTANVTILEGWLGTTNSSTIVSGGGFVLDGFTIQNVGQKSPESGNGAVRVDSAGVSNRIANCRFMNNGSYTAGALYLGRNGTFNYIENCIFSTNYAVQNGAVYIWGDDSQNVFSNCVFEGNVSGQRAAGVRISGSNSTNLFQSCVFTSNTCGQLGGAIFSFADETTYNRYDDCEFYENVSGGGVLFASQAGTRDDFYNCIFKGNQNAIQIQNTGAVVTVVNSVFYSNRVDAAVYVKDGAAYITNSIFWANEGSVRDIEMDNSTCTVTIAYSILITNAPNVVTNGGTINWGPGIISSDPLFADAAADDFHLRSRYGRWTGSGWVNDGVTSPGVDAGDPSHEYRDEASPDGKRINIGRWGNRSESSRSRSTGTLILLN